MEQVYTDSQIGKILNKIIAKARYELMLANQNGTVTEVMNDYGVSLDEGAMFVKKNVSKILVVGELAGKKKDYIQSAKKLNIPESNIVFESNYEDLTNLNLTKLAYSFEYSDVIFGPVPHSMAGKGDASNMIACMEKEPDVYPRVERATANNELKLSISSFRNALRQTRYYESMLS